MSYGHSIDSCDSLWISDWWYTFVGPAGGLGIHDTVGPDATVEADLVLIGEKLADGAPSALPVEVVKMEVQALALKLVLLEWDHLG